MADDREIQFDPAAVTMADQSEESVKPESVVEELPVGAQVGRYLILSTLGKGGMGIVYMAYDPELDRRIALKVMAMSSQARDGTSAPSSRLLREAQALAQLSHRNVVTVYDVGTFRDDVFIAMELVAGKTLRSWLSDTNPSMRQILDTLAAAGRGLAAAHQAGLVHRDFKPENVIVGPDGRVCVLDFGLVRTTNFVPEEHKQENPVDFKTDLEFQSGDKMLSTPLTRQGALMGTVQYMSPEQFLQEEVDEKSDQFSFCVTLFEALCGQRPFVGRTIKKVAANMLAGEFSIAPDKLELPLWIKRILLRGLSLSPKDRYDSMHDLLEELQNDPELARQRLRAVRRRTLFASALGLLLGIVLLALYDTFWAAEEKCQGGLGYLQNVWDQPLKQKIHTAFVSTGKTYSQEAFEHTKKVLDTYANNWNKMYIEACQATWIQGSQSEELLDWRMACLHRRLSELGALTEILANADSHVLEKAVQAGHDLTPISRCADLEALVAKNKRVKAPGDEQTAQEVKQLQSALLQVKAFESTGKYKEGLELASQTLVRAQAVRYLPIQAQAHFWQGTLQERSGQYQKSRESYSKALWAAIRSGDDELEARSALGLMYVVGRRLAKHEQVEDFTKHAEAAVDWLGREDELRAQWHNNLATLCLSKGEYDQVLEHYARALAIRKRRLGYEHPDVAMSLNNVGIAYYMKGDLNQALKYYLEGLSIFEKTLGANHPGIGRNLNNIGVVYDAIGEYEKAIATYKRALTIWKNALGEMHPDVAMIQNNLGEVLVANEDYGSALQSYQKARSIWKAVLGESHPDVAMGLYNIGHVLMLQSRYEQALESIHPALEILTKALGQDHPRLAYPLQLLGEVYQRMGKRKKAKHYFQRALGIRQKALGVDHPLNAPLLLQLAVVLEEEGKLREAYQLSEHSLRICETKRCDPEMIAKAYFSLAKVVYRHDSQRAYHLAQLARQTHHQGKKNKRKIAEITGWLKRHAL